MKLVVGLGNPGEQYAYTRHNAGFMVVDALARHLGAGAFSLNRKFKAEITQIGEVILAKPQTFMNRSGEAVQKILQFYKIPVEHLFVIHDDLDIGVGEYKIVQRGPKIHNGVNSIRNELGRDDFWYVRFGVDGRTLEQRAHIAGQDYVLMQLTGEERDTFAAVVDRVGIDLQKRLTV